MKQYILVSPVIGESILHGVTNWDEVVSYLHDSGYVNLGKVKVVERNYQWVCDTPQFVDTNY
jgi:hypothetical protein